MNYLDKTIVAPLDNEKALTMEEVSEHIENLNNWELLFDSTIGYFIRRVFTFDDSDNARTFIQKMKEVEKETHAIPQLQMKGTGVQIRCYSPELKGVHLNDLIMAAHADELYERWDISTGERDKVTQASDESFPASDPPGY